MANPIKQAHFWIDYFYGISNTCGMLTHHILFWLRKNLEPEQINAFRRGLEELKNIEVIKSFQIGSPAPINRAIVDCSYTFSLLLTFEDLEAHDVYQKHPIHRNFLDHFKSFFEKVVIYDSM